MVTNRNHSNHQYQFFIKSKVSQDMIRSAPPSYRAHVSWPSKTRQLAFFKMKEEKVVFTMNQQLLWFLHLQITKFPLRTSIKETATEQCRDLWKGTIVSLAAKIWLRRNTTRSWSSVCPTSSAWWTKTNTMLLQTNPTNLVRWHQGALWTMMRLSFYRKCSQRRHTATTEGQTIKTTWYSTTICSSSCRTSSS